MDQRRTAATRERRHRTNDGSRIYSAGARPRPRTAVKTFIRNAAPTRVARRRIVVAIAGAVSVAVLLSSTAGVSGARTPATAQRGGAPYDVKAHYQKRE